MYLVFWNSNCYFGFFAILLCTYLYYVILFHSTCSVLLLYYTCYNIHSILDYNWPLQPSRHMNPMTKSTNFPVQIHQLEPELYELSMGFENCSHADVLVSAKDEKIFKYRNKDLVFLKALWSSRYTILVNMKTWYLLLILTCVSFLAFGIVMATGGEYSIAESSITVRLQVLLSFVLTSYVGISLARWNTLRNTTFGQVWGSLENLYMIAARINHNLHDKTEMKTRETVLRLCRATMRLLFKAAGGVDDISDLEFEQLLTEKETPVLKQANIGTRAFVVIGWLEAIFISIKKQLKDIDASPWEWHKQLQNAKGGIGATLGMLGCPLPYIYTHLVYWIVQLVLISLAIETGTWMAIGVARRENGDGEYVFSDDAHDFPDNPRVWYANMFMVKVFSNVCFALFTEGLLQICDKIQNPFSKDDEHAFPIKLYDIFFNNNCRALVFGFDSRAFIDDHSFV